MGRAQPAVLAVIALGAMAGAAGRFELAEVLPSGPGAFPWATFWVNVSGSFLLGFLLVILIERLPPAYLLRPFLGTGLIGALTTMSTFLVEVAVLIKDHHVATGLLYGFASIVVGLLLAWSGMASARLVPGRPTGARR